MAGQKLVIVPLETRPQDAMVVAEWIISEWGRLPVHDYLEKVFYRRNPGGKLPRTIVALHEDQVVGTVSILSNDLEGRPEFEPWLGCLFVLPIWRRRGIGTKLLQSAERTAGGELCIKSLYLFTEKQADLYANLGWVTVELDTYRGHDITIMTKNVGLG